MVMVGAVMVVMKVLKGGEELQESNPCVPLHPLPLVEHLRRGDLAGQGPDAGPGAQCGQYGGRWQWRGGQVAELAVWL